MSAYLLTAACYRPELSDCTVECEKPNECASGQVCNRGWCTAPDVTCDEKDTNLTADASGTIDTSPPLPSDSGIDASCAAGCTNGTCEGGVCVIDCSVDNTCPNDILCPAGLPCRVLCGTESCDKKILCGNASSCDIQCTGYSSCGDEIQCGTGDCTVTCSGTYSCHRRTKCSTSCACDVTCTGLGSCPEASECPALACKVGTGCTSALAGCDDCPAQ